MQLIESELNGKKIAYSSETVFLVQVRRGHQPYKTRISTNNLAQAVLWFNSINVGNGYIKRLYSQFMNKPVLARVAS